MDGRVRCVPEGLTCVPANEGRDSPLLPWSLVVHQLSSQGQRRRDGLEVMSHQNAWRTTAKIASNRVRFLDKCFCFPFDGV